MPEPPLTQESLFFDEQSFTTARAGAPLYCHQDFLEKMETNRANVVGKRAALLLHRLLVDERRQPFKSTQGVNRGWRRSRLGGSSGSHFYAWWAPKSAAPLKDAGGFADAPDGSVFIRDIRHHDDHSELYPQSLNDNYLHVSVTDLRRQEYVPSPWTANQTRFATARQTARTLKGFPGSGKTTALWDATDRSTRTAALYVTYSNDLAALARDQFDKFSPAQKRFHVVPFARLLRDVLVSDAPVEPLREARARFFQELAAVPSRVLGPWVENKYALYDEIHAHLVGSAIPMAVGRFPASSEPHLSDKIFRQQREPYIGRLAVAALLDVAATLRRRAAGEFVRRFFPELDLAWQAVRLLLQPGPSPASLEHSLEFDCIAIDEVQDLTPIEAFFLIELAAASSRRNLPITFLAAGDEAQTVRPTDFEWGWFQDLLNYRLARPSEFKLDANLRSPRRIAQLVNTVFSLYGHLSKADRPSGSGLAQIDEDAGDQLLHCCAAPGEDLDTLLRSLASREGLAVICFEDQPPAYVPADIHSRILTVAEAKGLDFHSVCLLDPGKYLNRVLRPLEREQALYGRTEDLYRRLAIDRLRVAVSRPAERLIWLDVSPTESVIHDSASCLHLTSRDSTVPVVSPSAVLKSLEEESLDVEERVRACENDARQFLEIKPELSWSRALQAVALATSPQSAVDAGIVRSAHLTLAQIAFCLDYRAVRLPHEFGRVPLGAFALDNAEKAGLKELGAALAVILLDMHGGAHELAVAESLVKAAESLPAWLKIEIEPRAPHWYGKILAALDQPAAAAAAAAVLPRFLEIFPIPEVSPQQALSRAIKTLIAAHEFRQVLDILPGLPEPDPLLEGQCHEGLGDLATAATRYLAAEHPADALRCYRAIPDFDAAIALLPSLPDHPAAHVLDWIARLRETVAVRPDGFNRLTTPAERKLLEEILEQALGVQRRKKTAAVKKAAVKKAPAKKPAAKKAAAKKPAGRRSSSWPSDTPWF